MGFVSLAYARNLLADLERDDACAADGSLRGEHADVLAGDGADDRCTAAMSMLPHAGEHGTMVREEIEIIEPAIAALRSDGIAVTGPASADTLFHAAARRRYDAVLCMYHDQALIPIKTLAFDHAVNVTLGLPFVRTSPDHGTAFDIAGTGTADATSLIAALRLAARLAMADSPAPISAS